jgi:DNA-directed RNA polymerase specialized sigma24 family protein
MPRLSAQPTPRTVRTLRVLDASTLTVATAPSAARATPARVSDGGDDDDARAKLRARKRGWLNERPFHEELRKIIRMKRVAMQEIEDVLGVTIMAATESLDALPDEREQAVAYVCGIAANKSRDHIEAVAKLRARTAPLGSKVVEEDDPGGAEPEETTAAPEPVSADDATELRRMYERAKRLFPNTYQWFFRAKYGRETHSEIAEGTGKSADAVRQTVTAIGHALARDGTRKGFVGLLVLMLVFAGFREWRIQRPGGPADVATFAQDHAGHELVPSGRTRMDPVDDAAQLRITARLECLRGQWEACLVDLQSANRLDPVGETPELGALLDHAADMLDPRFAKPGSAAVRHHHVPGSGAP